MKQIGLSLLVILAAAGVTHAGLKGSYPVVVLNGQGYGGLGTARSAALPNTMIGCSSQVSQGGGYWAYCQANDGNRFVQCTTTDPELLAQIRSLQSDSRLTFYFTPSTGVCTSIIVETFSMQEPKAP